MASIYLLRHGESTFNVKQAEIVGGRSNHAPLTHKGHVEANRAGEYLLEQRITPDVIMSSPAVRALTTIEDVLHTIGSNQTIITDDRLQELGQGIMEGRARHEVWTEAVLAEMRTNPMDFAHSEGETFHNVQARMLDWYRDTVRNYPDSIILAGGHGLAIRALAGALLNWSHSEIMATTTPNCSLTRIDDDNGETSVAYVGLSTAK